MGKRAFATTATTHWNLERKNGNFTLHWNGNGKPKKLYHLGLIPHIFVWGSCFWFCTRRPPSRLLRCPLFGTQLCHTHNFVTHLSHTTLSRTLFHTQLCHTPSLTHNFVTHRLSHTSSFTHNFVTHTIFHTQLWWIQWNMTFANSTLW